MRYINNKFLSAPRLYINIFKNLRRAKYRCSPVSPSRLRGRILSKASLQPSIEPYVLLGAPSNLTDLQTARGRTGGKVGSDGVDRCGVSRGKKSGSKGIFIEWILKLMVATSDMLIRRANGFLITPGDGQEITEG